jgi:hypothetical protein
MLEIIIKIIFLKNEFIRQPEIVKQILLFYSFWNKTIYLRFSQWGTVTLWLYELWKGDLACDVGINI